MNNKKHYYAFFDVDGTLIKGTSMLDMLRFYYLNRFSNSKLIGEMFYQLYLMKSKLHAICGRTRESLNKQYYRCYKNQDVNWLKQIGEYWFSKISNNNKDIYVTNVLNEMLHHQRNKAEIVLVTGSFFACLEPFAQRFKIKHILCTNLEVNNSRLTGNILPPQTIGKGKSEAILHFIEEQKFTDLQRCYAYGDHTSDIPMLSLVGHPVVVSGNQQLEKYAKEKGWKIIY